MLYTLSSFTRGKFESKKVTDAEIACKQTRQNLEIYTMQRFINSTPNFSLLDF